MQAPIISLSPARRKFCSSVHYYRSTPQHYSLLPYCTCSPLYNWPPRPLKTSAAFPPHFHILPTVPRIRLRMPCTGFLYPRGIISHPHVKIDYNSILPPEQKWLFDCRPILLDTPLHTFSFTVAYPIIKTAGQGLMVGFLYFCITKV